METETIQEDRQAEQATTTHAQAEQAQAPTPTSNPTENTPVMAPRIKTFDGRWINALPRTVIVTDLMTGKEVVQKTTLVGVERAVVQSVVGKGPFSTTGEESVTLYCQYEPGKTCRITASAQNLEPMVKAILKGNVNQSSGTGPNDQIDWPLYTERVVTVYGSAMKGFGILASEAWVHLPDGSVKKIFGHAVDPNQETANTARNLFT
jgi:hypothetical protein